MQIQPLGQGDPLEDEMATHSSIPAWKIPWTEEPGGVAKSRTRLSDFTFTLSLIRKNQKQHKCPSAMEYVNRLRYIYTLDASNKL